MNTPCKACGYDPSIPVIDWHELWLDYSWPSQNQIGSNTGGRGKWMYRKAKKVARAALEDSLAHTPIPEAEGYRRLWVVRYYAKGKRKYDRANMAGGGKAIIDLLIDYDILLDDRPGVCEIYYSQEKSPTGQDMVCITIEDLEYGTQS